MLLSVGLVAAQTGLPGAGWESGQQIQNVSGSPANIDFKAYNQTGAETDCGSNANVASGASVNYLTSACAVPAGFVGSAVVSADQEIAAIVNVNNRTISTAAGQYRGTDSASVSTSISFPLVKHNFGARTTTFYVQNAGTSAADITATFVTGELGGATTTRSHTYPSVPASAMVIVSPADANVPSGDLGSLTVSSANNLAGTSLEHEHTATVGANLQASRAFAPSDGDTTLFCPLYRKAHTPNGFSTGVQVQNVSGATQNITFEFTPNDGSAVYSETAEGVANGASYTFFSGSIAGIANGKVGSAKVTSGGAIVAVVNDRAFNLNPSRLSTYACFGESSATTTVVLPLYKEYFPNTNTNTTGIQIVNAGNAAATATVTYAPVGGAAVNIETASIPAGGSVTMFGVSQGGSGIPALQNTFGGVTITSSQPIFAIANESSFAVAGQTASGQDNKNYEGFNR